MSELLDGEEQRLGAAPSLRVAEAAAAVQGGDDRGWVILHGELGRLVRWHAHQRFGFDTADVDDIRATVWVQLVQNIDRIEKPTMLSQWLSTTTAQACVRLASRQIRRGDPPAQAIRPCPEAGVIRPIVEEVICNGLQQEVLRVVAGNPDRRRQLVGCLLDPNEPDYVEIARLLEIPAGLIGPTRLRSLQIMASHPAIQALVV